MVWTRATVAANGADAVSQLEKRSDDGFSQIKRDVHRQMVAGMDLSVVGTMGEEA